MSKINSSVNRVYPVDYMFKKVEELTNLLEGEVVTTKEKVDAHDSLLAEKANQTDLDPLASKDYVNSQILTVNTGGTIDLSTKADKTYVDNVKEDSLVPVLTVDGRAISVTAGKYGGWDGISGYSSSKYAVSAGDVIRIVSFNNASTYIQYAFYNTYDPNNSMNATWFIQSTDVIYNSNGKKVWDIVVPAGAKMLCTTVKTGGSCLVYKNTALNSTLSANTNNISTLQSSVGTQIPATWTTGFAYGFGGDSFSIAGCQQSEIDISNYRNETIGVVASAHGSSYCLFLDANRNVINRFQTDFMTQGSNIAVSVRVPNNAKYLRLSNQISVVANPLVVTQKALSKPTRAKKVILDTDLTGDIDDLIAVRYLLWAERQGIIDIIGINLNTKYDTSVDGLDGFLNHDGVRDMCIGLESTSSTIFSSYLDTCSNFPHAYRSNYHAEDSLEFYNRALASVPNNEKIEIISIGMLTSLKRLIVDHSSDLSYLSNRINKIWVMGGKFPSGHEYNFCGNANAGQLDTTITNNTDYFLKNWPTEIVFCGMELGGLVKTGQILSQQSMTYDLLYKSISAYATTYGTTDLTDGHSSYDPITVLFACEDNVGVSNIDYVRGTATINTTTGDNSFTVSSTGKHYYIVYSHTSNVEWGKMVARKINATLTMENWNIREDIGKYRLPRIYKNTLLPITWEVGYYYDSTGSKVVQSACSDAQIDVSAYVGKSISVRVSAHGGAYCLFTDASNNVISTFQTDTVTQGVGTVKTVTIPSTAKYLLLSNQWNKVAENFTYAIVIG